jgi:hypothetical protein
MSVLETSHTILIQESIKMLRFFDAFHAVSLFSFQRANRKLTDCFIVKMMHIFKVVFISKKQVFSVT